MAPHNTATGIRLVSLLRELPTIKKLKEKFEFVCRATVETGGRVDFQQARAWAIPDEDAAFRNLEGRALPHPNRRDDSVLWNFELDADAVLFASKFGGILRGPIDVGAWRRGEF